MVTKKSGTARRREDSLSPERIVEASIELLDGDGEAGLTFRALSERLATGPGAIYWHVANKDELLVAACDAVVERTLAGCTAGRTPQQRLRALALGMFDAMDRHPWIGAALVQAAGRLPMVRLLERIGQQVQALGVAPRGQWAGASALLHYIIGVGGQNAANRLSAQARTVGRTEFLGQVAQAWSRLDPTAFPFTHAQAAKLAAHDDRADFLAGVDLIVAGMGR
ncbi:TetR/AcrR family transcriptional regulator [Pelomonas sp. KK5]|uniref:TetR/AcrR family transcriptional regulator n=1 Tax=Pelomonas sp. KK5 TaxID=1855730 RepID=UPI00097C1532|nr:TetR family transcriptional regulator [Pelomonas sp. KK5]